MEHEVWRFWMTKLDAGLMKSLLASDPGSAAVWGSKRINPRPQFCLCLTCSGYSSNDDDDDDNGFNINVNIFVSKIDVIGKELFVNRGIKFHNVKLKELGLFGIALNQLRCKFYIESY